MDIKKTMENLEKNGIKPYFVETREEVVPLVKTLINKGESVSNGGSQSLKETGVSALLACGDYDFIDRTGLEGEELRQSYIRAFGCDTYFCSSNAVTENGELYNVDGNSNRVACIVYGPRQVIMVVGVNKIVKDIKASFLQDSLRGYRKMHQPEQGKFIYVRRLCKSSACLLQLCCICKAAP